jgi:IS30 family transposase
LIYQASGRHLTSLQKRELIETLLKRDPHRSDRQIAKLVGGSAQTVAP